jgi:hypothetical protein
MRPGAAIACMTLLVLGCMPRTAPSDPEASRLFSENSILAAVSKPGARVCRRMHTGISEADIVRGVVMEARDGTIRVRVENAGRLPHVIGGIALAPKTIVWDDAKLWVPCL